MTNKKYDVITIFDTCVDLIVNLGNITLEFDQKEKLVQDFGLYMGGSACIFAAQCAKLKLLTSGVGVVGIDSFGQMIKASLSNCGVDTEFLSCREDIKTSLGIALNRGVDRAILTYDQSILTADAAMLTDALLGQAKHLHIASYYLLQRLKPELPNLLHRAKSIGLTTSLDTNWDPEEKWELPEEVLRLIDVFLPNENEILLLSGQQDISGAIEYFLKYIPLIVVKLGENGAMALTRDRKVIIPARKVMVADTVGAGDSFDGGFLYGYLNGYDLEECLRFGVICGSENVSKFGGIDGQADLSRLQAILQQESLK